jgi:heptosyltransferase-1
VKLSSLGDVVHALPLLEALRVGLGEAMQISWVVRPKFADLLHGNPHLSQRHLFRGNLWEITHKLRAERFDVALDTQGLFVSGMVTRLSGARRRIGFDVNREGNRLFLTEAVVPARERQHVVERLMGFCEAMGIPRLPVRVQSYLANGECEAAETLLLPAHSTPKVGCILGASTLAKAWSPARWAELLRLLERDGLQPVLLGGPGEVALAEQLGSGLNLVGKTSPRVLASVLARCQVVVGGDSGPTHLAVAVGTPVVGLYGVTDPARTGPQWGVAPSIVLDLAKKDAPPETRRPRHPTLHDAIERIPAEAVLEAVRRLQA